MKLNKFIKTAAAVLLCSAFTANAFAQQTENAWMLYESPSVWYEDNGNMKFKAYLSAGDKMEVYTGTEKDAVRVSSSGNVTRNFIQTKYGNDGKTYWLQTAQLAKGNVVPALLLEDAVVYDSTNLLNPSGTVLDKYTIVCYEQQFTATSYFKVSKIYYYDSRVTGSVVSGYVLSDKVLSGENNIKVYNALNNIKTTTDVEVKMELFSNIQLMNPAPELTPLMEEVRGIIEGTNLLYGGIENLDSKYEIPQYMLVSDENISFLDVPGTRGETVAVTSFGISAKDWDPFVVVSKRTVLTETINGVTDHWYYVRNSNGDEGWVFGAYVHLVCFSVK